MINFLLLVIIRAIQARLTTRRRHSFYNGYPCLCLLNPHLDETNCKTYLEPLLAALTGLGVMSFNAPLGRFLMISAAALAIKTQVTAHLYKNRDLDEQDALIEHEWQVQRFRRRNDWN